MENDNIFDKFHSGFHQYHSFETAILRVSNDFLINTDVLLITFRALHDMAPDYILDLLIEAMEQPA